MKKEKVVPFLIGLLVGAIIATGCFCMCINSKNRNFNKHMESSFDGGRKMQERDIQLDNRLPNSDNNKKDFSDQTRTQMHNRDNHKKMNSYNDSNSQGTSSQMPSTNNANADQSNSNQGTQENNQQPSLNPGTPNNIQQPNENPGTPNNNTSQPNNG